MTYDNPECAQEKLTPCSAADWQQCDQCFRVVCLRHGDLYEVCGAGEQLYCKVYMLFQRCVDAGWEHGEWSCGEYAQYVNHR